MGTMEWPHPHSSSLLSGSHLGGVTWAVDLPLCCCLKITPSPGPNPPNPIFSTRDSDQSGCLDTPFLPFPGIPIFLGACPAELGRYWG